MMKSARAVAIIPARGGSKGIARKNLRPVAGQPLLVHAIHAAQGARHVARVVVSTDDAEIARVAQEWGAEVVHRPAEISGDGAASEEAILHALQELKTGNDGDHEIVVFLQCTSPLTTPADIDGTVDVLLGGDADAAFAAADFHSFLWQANANGEAEAINHDHRIRARRQDRADQFIEAGAVYVMRSRGFQEARHRFFGRTLIYPMPAARVFEVDEPQDLIVADALLREQQRERRRSHLPVSIDAVVMDFDGVFTDNRVLVFADGEEAVVCDRGDGMGLSLLQGSGVPLLVISKERNPVLRGRLSKLQVPCIHEIDDKLPALESWADSHGYALDRIVYVGNDVNDIDCLTAVGCGVVVADAHPSARAAATLVLRESGGHGALRELSDLILERVENSTSQKVIACPSATDP